MKANFLKQHLYLTAVSTLLLALPALAVSNPSVIEESDAYGIEYTIVNPIDSIGTIVGFVVEASYNEHLWAYANNGWGAQGQAALPLDATTWGSNMTVNWPEGLIWPLTWCQFFGGIDYPFGEAKSVGYFVNYSEVAPDTYQFEWAYSKEPYHLPILPGETRDDFSVLLVPARSQYLLAYIDDAEHGTFCESGLPWCPGEAVPEPATLCLLGIGGLVAMRRSRT